jgi:hypothetical protein
MDAVALELRLDVDGVLTDELARLHRCLAAAPRQSRRRATLLVQLGEIRLRAGDEAGAVEALEEADGIVSHPDHRLPDARMLLEALDASLEALAAEERVEGPSAIEEATRLRELHRRLHAAMAKALRHRDAAEADRHANLAIQLGRPLDLDDDDAPLSA